MIHHAADAEKAFAFSNAGRFDRINQSLFLFQGKTIARNHFSLDPQPPATHISEIQPINVCALYVLNGFSRTDFLMSDARTLVHPLHLFNLPLVSIGAHSHLAKCVIG